MAYAAEETPVEKTKIKENVARADDIEVGMLETALGCNVLLEDTNDEDRQRRVDHIEGRDEHSIKGRLERRRVGTR